jgi:hypothetical protein
LKKVMSLILFLLAPGRLRNCVRGGWVLRGIAGFLTDLARRRTSLSRRFDRCWRCASALTYAQLTRSEDNSMQTFAGGCEREDAPAGAVSVRVRWKRLSVATV